MFKALVLSLLRFKLYSKQVYYRFKKRGGLLVGVIKVLVGSKRLALKRIKMILLIRMKDV